MRNFTTALGAALMPASAIAHPDHSTAETFGLGHLLTDPFHVALALGALLLFLVVRRSVVRGPSATRSVRRGRRVA